MPENYGGSFGNEESEPLRIETEMLLGISRILVE